MNIKQLPTKGFRNVKQLYLLFISMLFCLDPVAHEAKNAETDYPLPSFSACSSNQKPLLPAKWESGALLQHFSDPALITANLVYDESAGAIRFTMAGMSGGSGDFLLQNDGKLFGLSGGYPSPTQCRFLGDTELKVPSRQWMSDESSLCVGEGLVTNKNLVWWKYKVAPVSTEVAQATFSHSAPNLVRKQADSFSTTPQPPGADWVWYHKNSQLPYRTMFSIPNNNFAILGRYTFNYLPTFRPVQSTNLATLKTLCNQPGQAENAEFDSSDAERFLKENTLTEKQRTTLPSVWVPGLQATSRELPPSWPLKAETTTFLTSVNYCYAPFPSRVYFDWYAQSQLTSMYWNNNGAVPPGACAANGKEFYVQQALLRGKLASKYDETGFIFNRSLPRAPASQCAQVLPGIQVPDWKNVDGCVAKAQLAPNTVLNPSNEVVKILRCPITPYGAPVPQVFLDMVFRFWDAYGVYAIEFEHGWHRA